jgi:hypothetical protein
VKKIYIAIIMLFLLIGASSELTAASTSKSGKDFWLTFIPNYHDGDNNDSLFIYVTSAQETDFKIEYRDKFANEYSFEGRINNPEEVVKFGLFYKTYELEGYIVDHKIDMSNQCETPVPQSFHITSDEIIVAYGLNKALKTSDAFLVIPTKGLGLEYYVMSYNSDMIVETFWGEPYSVGSHAPSEFAIVATEDDTQINITLAPDRSWKTKSKNLNAILDKGEVYLVQAYMNESATSYDDNPSAREDLTGTYIKSDKPVAVFGGHQRALVPRSKSKAGISRDMLCSQMPPINIWGRNAFLTPFPEPIKIYTNWEDRYRIIAAYDGTDIYKNGSYYQTLDAGEFHESDLTEGVHFTSENPIMVAQIKMSSGVAGNTGVSDPCMMIMPAKEQFRNNYTLVNIHAYDDKQNIAYSEHYLIVITAKMNSHLINLDGLPFDEEFIDIENSEFAYAVKQTASGAHTLESDSVFGVWAVGYGDADSYAYIGGYGLLPDVGLVFPDTVCDVSQYLNVPIQITANDNTYKADPYDKFVLSFSYDRDFLYPEKLVSPTNGTMTHTVNGSIRTTTITGPYQDNPEGLAVVGYKTMLNDMECMSFSVDSLKFYAVDGSEYEGMIYLEKFYEGEICLNLCEADGTRFFVSDGSELKLYSSSPNPVVNTLKIKIELIDNGYTELYIVDILGNKAAEVYSGAGFSDEQDYEVDIRELSSGLYFTVLKTPTAVLRTKFNVLR